MKKIFILSLILFLTGCSSNDLNYIRSIDIKPDSVSFTGVVDNPLLSVSEEEKVKLINKYLGSTERCEKVARDFLYDLTGINIIPNVNLIPISNDTLSFGDLIEYTFLDGTSHISVYIEEDIALHGNLNGVCKLAPIYLNDATSISYYRIDFEQKANINVSCVNATNIGFGYESLKGTEGCVNTDDYLPYYQWISELNCWTNKKSIIETYSIN